MGASPNPLKNYVTIGFEDVGGAETQKAVSATDPLPVTGSVVLSGTSQVDVTDEPTRDLGKVDVASLDQYTPIAGRLPIDGSGVTQPVSAASLPLPAGASTEATLGTLLAEATFTGRINTQGQKTMVGSTPVVLASDHSAIPISGTVTSNPATAYGKTITYVSISQGAAGTTILASALPGNRHKVLGSTIVMDSTGTVKITDGGGDLTGAMSIATNGGFVWPTSLIPYVQTAVNSALNLVTTLGAAKGVVMILTEP